MTRSHVPDLFRRFLGGRRGNVAMITALALIPLVFAAGMAIDYTMATRRQDQINGFADAAALAAVTPSMMTQSWSTAKSRAQDMFLAQLATVPGVTYSAANITVSGGDVSSGSKITRTATVSYSAGSANLFGGVLGLGVSTIRGSSTASSANSPRTNFYLLVDTSPSMEIAATTTGIDIMVAHTPAQGGCAFGCHEYAPANDHLGNPWGEDNYQLARNLGVTLRIDLVRTAASNLMSTAYSTATQNNTTYQAAIYTMDYTLSGLLSTPVALNSQGNVQTAQTAAANIAPLEVWDNNCLTYSKCNNDEDSYLDAGVSGMNSLMPEPGDGMGADSAQEVLMIVSDAVIDESYNGSRAYHPINTLVDNCTLIKNRGIRIAFLYLTYNPLPTNAWYNTYIAPFQDQIAPAAQACASPGLYFQVNTDGDVSSALAALFQKAVATARLTQ